MCVHISLKIIAYVFFLKVKLIVNDRDLSQISRLKSSNILTFRKRDGQIRLDIVEILRRPSKYSGRSCDSVCDTGDSSLKIYEKESYLIFSLLERPADLAPGMAAAILELAELPLLGGVLSTIPLSGLVFPRNRNSTCFRRSGFAELSTAKLRF